MELSLQVNGIKKLGKEMVEASRYGLMVVDMKDIGKKTKLMEEED